MTRYCTLSVPPGAEIKSQITNSEVRKTKNIANLRIHVERAIKRIKSYRILKSVLPLIVLHSCDDIIRTCARQWNLKPLLFKNSTTTEWYLLLCFIVSFLRPFFCGMILENVFSKKTSFKFAVLKSLICSEVLFFSQAEQNNNVNTSFSANFTVNKDKSSAEAEIGSLQYLRWSSL